MNLLGIETATDLCGVAIVHDGRLLAEAALMRPRAHAENLVPMIESVLRQAGLARTELDAVAVSMGPGSFTGLRIGVSTAKGLVAALGVPLVGVPTLEALAAGVVPWAEAGDAVGAVFHARLDEVYVAAYLVGPATASDDGSATDEDLRLKVAVRTAALPADEAAARLLEASGGRVWLVGDGASRLFAGAADGRPGRVRVVGPEAVRPSAGRVARAGRLRLLAGLSESPGAFEPLYIKEFEARKRTTSIFDRLPF